MFVSVCPSVMLFLSLFSFFVIFSSILNFLNSWHYFNILLISNILATIGRECPCFYKQMVYVKTSEATTPLETVRLLDVGVGGVALPHF